MAIMQLLDAYGILEELTYNEREVLLAAIAEISEVRT